MKAEVIAPIAVKRQHAAAMLSMSIDSFERHVQPHLKLVQTGTMIMVPVAELERYVAEHAQFYGAAAR